MITRRIDGALEALAACRALVPDLRDLYRKGSVEREALDEVLAIVRRADEVLTGPGRRRE